MYGVDVDLSRVQASTGVYYSSVTDSYEPVPSGAPSYGNASQPRDESGVAGVWQSLGRGYDSVTDTVSDAASSAWQGVKSGVGSVASGVGGFISEAQWSLIKTLALIFGALLVTLFVIGKSGIIGQAAPIAGAYMGR